jgi:hypothetical protein
MGGHESGEERGGEQVAAEEVLEKRVVVMEKWRKWCHW